MTSDTIGPDARPQLNQGAELIVVADEALIYETDTGGIHKLDPVATAVCRLLDGQHTVDDVIDALAEAFGAARDTVASDVVALVVELEDRGLLTVRGAVVEGGPNGL